MMTFKTGKDNPSYGKPAWNRGLNIKFNNALDEWREGGGVVWNKGIPCSKETRDKISKKLKGRTLTQEHRDSIAKGAPRGIDHPGYIDGKGGTGYVRFRASLKEEIKIRDNNQCQNCSMTREEHNKKYNLDIEIHHIDYDKTNNNKNNLITLCKKCNIRANYNKDYWYEKYKKISNT